MKDSMRRLWLGVVVAACLWTGETRLAACSCIGSVPSCQATWQAAAVFTGTVVEIADVTPPPDPRSSGPFERRRVTFRVTERFRGEIGESAVVLTGSGGGDCGYAFVTRESYLIYAHRVPTGQLTTGICSRTRPVAEAAGDLSYLREAARGPSNLGTIQGVAKYPDPSQQFFNFADAPPYAGGAVTVEATDPGRTDRYETRTAADGTFAVKAPVGKYRASLAVRDGLYATGAFMPLQILDLRGCAQADFVVRPDGRIGGRVLDADGHPVSALSVEILSAEASRNRYYSSLERTRTSIDGAFEFSRLAPGEYVVGLTLKKDLKSDSTAVWFEPPAPAAPQVVLLQPEQRAFVGEVRLPSSVGLSAIRGTVTLEDGKPAAGTKVYVLTSPNFGISAGPVEVDRDGSFMFTVIAGREYRLSAELLGNDARWRKAESAAFKPEPGDMSPFALTFKPDPDKDVLARLLR